MSQTGTFSFFGNHGQVGPDGKPSKFNLQTLFDFSNLYVLIHFYFNLQIYIYFCLFLDNHEFKIILKMFIVVY